MTTMYVAVRAYKLSIVHDEAFTYTNYVTAPIIDTILYKEHFPNNHYLNSVLASISTRIISTDSIVALRLPSLLSYLIYIASAVAIATRVRSKLLGIALFVFLLTNLFVLEQFSLARGYGIGIAFMLASLAFLLYSFGSKEFRRLYQNIAVLLAAISLLANLTFLLFLIALLIYLLSSNFIVMFKGVSIRSRQVMRASAKYVDEIFALPIIAAGAIAFVSEAIIDQRTAGQFYYGGQGFIADTIGSIIKTSYNVFTSRYDSFILLVALITAAVPLILFVLYLWRNRNSKQANYSVALILFLLVSINVALHIITDTPYFLERTAIFLYPLYLVAVFLLLDGILKKYPAIELGVKTVAVCLLLVHLLLVSVKMNLTSSYTWRYDANTEEAIQFIVGKGVTEETQICVHWKLSPASGYYLEKEEMSQNMLLYNSSSGVIIPIDSLISKCQYVYSVGEIHSIESDYKQTYYSTSDTYIYYR